MAHNQEMLVSNSTWKSQRQVDIICISLDSEVDALNKRIQVCISSMEFIFTLELRVFLFFPSYLPLFFCWTLFD
jgi:hypothetical protein